jgi:hypothetical protein
MTVGHLNVEIYPDAWAAGYAAAKGSGSLDP